MPRLATTRRIATSANFLLWPYFNRDTRTGRSRITRITNRGFVTGEIRSRCNASVFDELALTSSTCPAVSILAHISPLLSVSVAECPAVVLLPLWNTIVLDAGKAMEDVDAVTFPRATDRVFDRAISHMVLKSTTHPQSFCKPQFW